MRHTPKTSSRGGFSITEVLITATIFAGVLGSTTLVVMTSSGAHDESSDRSHVADLARRAADRVCDELANASATGLFPDPQPFGTDNVLFQTATGVTGGAIDWSTPIRLSFQYDTGEVDDGVDNDGDGLVDEGSIVLTRDPGGATPMSIVLCRDVRELLEGETNNGLDDNGNGLVDESGFSLQRVGELVLVRITIEKPGPGNSLITSTIETGVRLRN